jgi:hypothetical protein
VKIKSLAIALGLLVSATTPGAAEVAQGVIDATPKIDNVTDGQAALIPPWEAKSHNMEVEIFRPSIHSLPDPDSTTIFFSYWVFDRSSGKRWDQHGHIFDCGVHSAGLSYAQSEAGLYNWSMIDSSSQKAQDFLWKLCREQLGDDVDDSEAG